VLWTGSDFVIIDFEGEPVRSLKERREKHSPLKDVTGMLRSFHYAAYAAMFSRVTKDVVASEAQACIEGWADAWHKWVSVAYLKEYLAVAAAGNFLPRNPQDLRTLFDIYLLEKAVYELIYELNNRPDWIRIPLQGVRELIG
jgi:maltose alpha-D-glucosyltransferase/alpha-amylase